MNPVVRAMLLLAIAMTLIPFMDAIAKELSTDHGLAPVSVAFGRFVSQTVILLCIFATLHIRRRSKPSSFVPPMRPARIPVHLTRGALHGGSSLLFFVAIKYMPLADTIAVFFVEPMILMLLASQFLGETIGWPRRIAAVIAFAGALLIIQPSYELFGPVSLLPLGAAMFFALYLLFTRRFGIDEHPFTMQLWSGMGAMTSTALVLVVGTAVGADDYRLTIPDNAGPLLLFLAIGIVSTIAHVLVVMAFKLANASVLAPFNYLEIVTATIVGYVLFDEFPGLLQWIGISIIIGTGLFVFFRERKVAGLA
jgi:drug/metabolite transporter (DMT)-like permease